MKSRVVLFVLMAVLSATPVPAQAPVATLTLDADQIGVVRTAQGLTTRVTFPEPVDEVICGDLYDAASGRGSFVAQPSGNDVFIKPIPAKGMSNLFVKTKGRRTYNFDLHIVPVAQAHRVVNVADAVAVAPPTAAKPAAPGADAQGQAEALLREARQQADALLREAGQQASRLVAEAEARALDIERQAGQRAAQEAEKRFVQSILLGLREVKINNPRAVARKVIIALDSRMLVFGDRAYLRYTIQNTGDQSFEFGQLALEVNGVSGLEFEIVQSKPSNRLESGESLAGVIVFDPKAVDAKDKLALTLRGADNAQIAQVSIQ